MEDRPEFTAQLVTEATETPDGDTAARLFDEAMVVDLGNDVAVHLETDPLDDMAGQATGGMVARGTPITRAARRRPPQGRRPETLKHPSRTK